MAGSPSSGGDGEAGSYSAAGPALGYLAQVEYALLLMLQRMETTEDLELSIETLDDVTFHDGDDPIEQFQTKHSINRHASLGDTSTDLWKTIHNWIKEAAVNHAALFLMTTATADDNTIANRLRAGAGRDTGAALIALERVARTATGATNADYYTAFLGLPPEERAALVERIKVVDGAANAVDLTAALLLAVRKAVRPQRREALVERLRGWWHGRAINHLDLVARHHLDRVSLAEVEGRLNEISESLRDGNLPIDFAQMPDPGPDAADTDTRIFVEQLRLVCMANARVRQCIYDHNRAYAQRSKWLREDLVTVGELGNYDALLQDEWRRHFTSVHGTPPAVIDDEPLHQARERFAQLDRSALPRIRPEVSAGYVGSGSLHVLADRLVIGWHPEWLEHLKHRLDEVGVGAAQEAA